MWHRIGAIAVTVLLFVGVLATSMLTRNVPNATPGRALLAEVGLASSESPMDAGVRFLEGQIDPQSGLLQESLTIGAKRRYLAQDALIASYAFNRGGRPLLARQLRQRIVSYDRNLADGNDFIELADEEPISWPPGHAVERIVKVLGDGECDLLGDGRGIDDTGADDPATVPCVLTITHDGDGYFYDWSAYSNLAFMAVANFYHQGKVEAAKALYDMQMGTFDGYGWQDKAYHDRGGVYETLGVAWALYATALVGPDTKERPLQLWRALLSTQDQRGGFHTHYVSGGGTEPLDAAGQGGGIRAMADANVETTAMALLALWGWQDSPHNPYRNGNVTPAPYPTVAPDPNFTPFSVLPTATFIPYQPMSPFVTPTHTPSVTPMAAGLQNMVPSAMSAP